MEAEEKKDNGEIKMDVEADHRESVNSENLSFNLLEEIK